jgi:hypothetical protein
MRAALMARLRALTGKSATTVPGKARAHPTQGGAPSPDKAPARRGLLAQFGRFSRSKAASATQVDDSDGATIGKRAGARKRGGLKARAHVRPIQHVIYLMPEANSSRTVRYVVDPVRGLREASDAERFDDAIIVGCTAQDERLACAKSMSYGRATRFAREHAKQVVGEPRLINQSGAGAVYFSAAATVDSRAHPYVPMIAIAESLMSSDMLKQSALFLVTVPSADSAIGSMLLLMRSVQGDSVTVRVEPVLRADDPGAQIAAFVEADNIDPSTLNELTIAVSHEEILAFVQAHSELTYPRERLYGGYSAAQLARTSAAISATVAIGSSCAYGYTLWNRSNLAAELAALQAQSLHIEQQISQLAAKVPVSTAREAAGMRPLDALALASALHVPDGRVSIKSEATKTFFLVSVPLAKKLPGSQHTEPLDREALQAMLARRLPDGCKQEQIFLNGAMSHVEIGYLCGPHVRVIDRDRR